MVDVMAHMGGFLNRGGSPKSPWISMLKWSFDLKDFGVPPIFGNLHMVVVFSLQHVGGPIPKVYMAKMIKNVLPVVRNFSNVCS